MDVKVTAALSLGVINFIFNIGNFVYSSSKIKALEAQLVKLDKDCRSLGDAGKGMDLELQERITKATGKVENKHKVLSDTVENFRNSLNELREVNARNLQHLQAALLAIPMAEEEKKAITKIVKNLSTSTKKPMGQKKVGGGRRVTFEDDDSDNENNNDDNEEDDYQDTQRASKPLARPSRERDDRRKAPTNYDDEDDQELRKLESIRERERRRKELQSMN